MILHLDDLEPGTLRGGRIWLDFGDEHFPEEGWYDLPGILLETWLPALQSFADGHTDICKLFFMDGPYAFRLCRTGEKVSVICTEQGRTALERQVDFPGFQDSVKKSVRYYERMQYLSTK